MVRRRCSWQPLETDRSSARHDTTKCDGFEPFQIVQLTNLTVRSTVRSAANCAGPMPKASLQPNSEWETERIPMASHVSMSVALRRCLAGEQRSGFHVQGETIQQEPILAVDRSCAISPLAADELRPARVLQGNSTFGVEAEKSKGVCHSHLKTLPKKMWHPPQLWTLTETAT